MKSKFAEKGFWSLVLTQVFGAANDNILKGVLVYMMIDGIWQAELGKGGQGYANSLFTIPFILLSGYAGRYADRNSKRDVVILVKWIEIPISIVGLIGFWIHNFWITLAALIALACQSAFYGPAKYGIIPEITRPRNLSRANGTMNMMTNLAVIVGVLAAGRIADRYCPIATDGTPAAAPSSWLPGVVMVIVSIAGLISAYFLPRLEPGDKTIRYEWNPFGTYLGAFKEMAGTPLMTVMFAWAYFYFLAGLALLVLPEYTIVLASYDVTRAEVSVLMGIMGIAIGFGCAVAGFASGHAIRPWMVPLGGIGLAIFFGLLGFVPPVLPDLPPFWRILASPVSFFILGAGICAGFYIVPLQALLQRLTPGHELGRFLGTANGLSFAFLLLSSLLYPIIRPVFSGADGIEHPEKIFCLASVFMAIGVVFFVWRVRARGFSLAKIE